MGLETGRKIVQNTVNEGRERLSLNIGTLMEDHRPSGCRVAKERLKQRVDLDQCIQISVLRARLAIVVQVVVYMSLNTQLRYLDLFSDYPPTL